MPVYAAQVILHDPMNLGNHTNYEDLGNLWGRIIQALLILVGTASLVVFVYAGFLFLTSSGNSETTKKARDTIIYAILGIFISMGAYIILKNIFGSFENIF